MARIGKWTKIWAGGYHLSTYSRDVAPQSAADEIEVGGYTQDKQYMTGRLDGSITIDGFFETTSHTALKTVGNTAVPVSIALGNNATPATGDPAFCLNSVETNYTSTPDLNGYVGLNVNFKTKSGKGLEIGTLLLDDTVTADGNGSSVDNGASSSNGGVGYLHITATSSGDTIAVTVQDSPDDAAWSDLVTFTIDGSAVAGERVEVTGTVNQYVRAEYDVTGTDVSFPIAVSFVRY